MKFLQVAFCDVAIHHTAYVVLFRQYLHPLGSEGLEVAALTTAALPP